MYRIVALIACVAIAGCAAGNVRWMRGTSTVAEFEADKARCVYEAKAATASGGNFGMSSAIGAGLAEGFKQIELMHACLEAKGWKQERVG